MESKEFLGKVHYSKSGRKGVSTSGKETQEVDE